MKRTTRLSKETKCSVDMETIQGMRKHRKVTLRAEETHDLQVVAWRLQEMRWLSLGVGCGLCRSGLLKTALNKLLMPVSSPFADSPFWMFVYFLISRQDLLYVLVFVSKTIYTSTRCKTIIEDVLYIIYIPWMA